MDSSPTCIRHYPRLLVSTFIAAGVVFLSLGVILLQTRPLPAILALGLAALSFLLSASPRKFRITLDKATDTLWVANTRWYRAWPTGDSRRLSHVRAITHLFPVRPNGEGFTEIPESGSLVVEMRDGPSLEIFPGDSAPIPVSVESIGQHLARMAQVPFEQHAWYEGYV